MAEISKVTLPSGTTYDIKDATARAKIAEVTGVASNAIYFIGLADPVSVSDGQEEATATLIGYKASQSVNIKGRNYTADASGHVNYTASPGDIVVTKDSSGETGTEYIRCNNTWQALGSVQTGSSIDVTVYEADEGTAGENVLRVGGTNSQPEFKGTASSASGSFTPSGTVSAPAFTGKALTSTGSFTPSGTVSVPSITVKPSTASVTPISGVGTLPSFTASVSGETLTLGFSAGTLPTKGTAVTVMTDATATASQPAFTGKAGSVSVSGTPSGTVSAPTFTGTAGTVSVSGTPKGTVSAPTFKGKTYVIDASFLAEE